jgi:hypothetical protein
VDPVGLDFGQCGPLRVVFDEVNAILISVAPMVAIMSHAWEGCCLLAHRAA